MEAIARFLYETVKRFDTIKQYEGETAPYCGHHYNGHDGKLTTGSYNEGMGGEHVKTKLFYLGYSSEEGHELSKVFYRTPDEVVNGQRRCKDIHKVFSFSTNNKFLKIERRKTPYWNDVKYHFLGFCLSISKRLQ